MRFGWQKINLHQTGKEFEPRAEKPRPGSADFCMVTDVPLRHIIERLAWCGVDLVKGPISRIGAIGTIESVYFRGPDGNLIEVSNCADGAG